MRKILLLLFIILSASLKAQEEIIDGIQATFDFEEYLTIVKKFHPIAKQADLLVNSARAEVLKARGGFDPKLEIGYDGKEFLGSDYFDILNATLKIPTWYGVEFKAGFDDNDGSFLNPENFIPGDGQLFSAGVSVSLGEGLFINKRMATLKKAKIFRELSQAERTLQVNQILTDASIAYFEWLKSYKEFTVFQRFLENSRIRYEGIRSQVIRGDKAAIDTIEAGITIRNRQLELEQSELKYLKSKLALSNFLWIKDNIPVELEDNVVPDENLDVSIDQTLQINNNLGSEVRLDQHPKIIALQQKIKSLEVDKKFKADKLKPRLDANYNFLSSDGDQLNTFNTRDFKAGFKFSFDLFLRKERGDLKLAKYKVQDAELNYRSERLQLQNKIEANYRELLSFNDQIILIDQITRDYDVLLKAEERKFGVGESSVFLINSRERKLIDSQLKQIEIQNKLFKTKVKLFNSLAIDPDTVVNP
ncbi:TolC family protein [Flavobacteriaceae bacterium R38]|nr:TolC family protein [Flavobacteriaceae bacterium R38]